MSPHPLPSALLIDLDGTLVDSRRDIAAALNAALASKGAAPLSLSEVLPMIGDGARKLVERGMAARGVGGMRGSSPYDAELATFNQFYLEHPADQTVLLPGAHELLTCGLPCALVTNKPRAVTILVLEHLGILTSFVEIWAGGDGPLKPAPDGILAVAAKLGVPVQSAWMIGDGSQDIAAARNAGAFSVGVPGIGDAEALAASKPDATASSLLEVASWVTSVSARSL